ncbi:MAG: hypothetical protein Q4D12_08110 [Bacteroidales bacterium]|nr:hypothetical protein [Bacteroidales bacterium]
MNNFFIVNGGHTWQNWRDYLTMLAKGAETARLVHRFNQAQPYTGGGRHSYSLPLLTFR